MTLPRRSVSSTTVGTAVSATSPAVAADDQVERVFEAELHDALDLLETLDLHAVDADDAVAGPQAGALRGAVRRDAGDLGRREGLADDAVHAGEGDDREQEIGERAGEDDRRALTEALVVERDGALFRGHLAERWHPACSPGRHRHTS